MFAHRQPFEGAGFLRSYSHRPLGPLRFGNDIHAKHADRACGWAELGCELPQEGRLTSAVRTDNSHHFSTPNFKTDTPVGLCAVPVNFDQVAHAHSNLDRWRVRERPAVYFNMRQAFDRGSQIAVLR